MELTEAETIALPANRLNAFTATSWRPQFAIIVFTGPGYGLLGSRDREHVWRSWGVPLLEHRVDEAGKVIAEECDVHNGLHLRAGAEWTGTVIRKRCACGLESSRIVPQCEDVETTVGVAA